MRQTLEENFKFETCNMQNIIKYMMSLFIDRLNSSKDVKKFTWNM